MDINANITINTKTENNICIILVSGDLNSRLAIEKLRNAIEGSILPENKKIILDLNKISLPGSQLIEVLLESNKTTKSKNILFELEYRNNENVNFLLSTTSIDKIIACNS